VQLIVSDTGHGTDDYTRERLFEPFFTTKDSGTGTGFGLAIVYGIVQQTGGHVEVLSAPGQGATFIVYFPRAIAPVPEPAAPEGEGVEVRRGDETILVVEDDAAVRTLTRRFLEQRGYTVLEAGSDEQALDLWCKHPGTINLLVTDVVMPDMSGAELARRLTLACPELKVLYISGYTGDAILRHGLSEGREALLAKPFTAAALAARVRAVLDA